MARGHAEEIEARRYYGANYAPVEQVGFVVNTRWGFPIGCSPDGLVGEDGLIEYKSRRAKYQVQTIVEHVFLRNSTTIPTEHVIHCQTALLVAERSWLDYISYSGGLPMTVIRVFPDQQVQEAIVDAATAFEERLGAKISAYWQAMDSPARLVETPRIMFTEELEYE